MKIEIESVINGYIITIPSEYDEDVERKIVIQEDEIDNFRDNEKISTLKAFNKLVFQLQEEFCVHNSKYNEIGYISGLCSEHERWSINEEMAKSLKNPRNSYDD
jgi:hypothetical protein